MGRNNYHIQKADLERMFVQENMRRSEIAKVYGCSEVTIGKNLMKFGIRKSFSQECKNKERRTTVLCPQCKREFLVLRNCITNPKHTRKFCSYDCANKSQDLGPDHRRKMRILVCANRRARKLNQSPPLTSEESQRLKEIYMNRPDGYEVDHIKPLAKGGLHHPDNLQYLTISENRKKWCKYNEPSSPDHDNSRDSGRT